jgi:hypothetical protein
MLPRRAAAFLRAGVGRFVLGVFFLLGLADRVAVVFFFELRARAVADFFFFFDVVLAEALEVDFFRVTFFLTTFRLADDLPALDAFFVFLPDFFLLGFFLLGFFLLGFFVEVFFLETVFFLPVFLDARAVGCFRELRFAAFFDTFFVADAFLFGMRFNPQVAPNEAGDYT